MLCTLRTVAPWVGSSPGEAACLLTAAFCTGEGILVGIAEAVRPRSDGLREGVDGTDVGTSSLIFLDVEATVLRAKRGTPEAVLGPRACELLASDEAPTWA
jgi:hypothetical protein